MFGHFCCIASSFLFYLIQNSVILIPTWLQDTVIFNNYQLTSFIFGNTPINLKNYAVCVCLGMNYSATGFEVVLTRKMSFYIITYYLPSGLFVVVSWIRYKLLSGFDYGEGDIPPYFLKIVGGNRTYGTGVQHFDALSKNPKILKRNWDCDVRRMKEVRPSL